MIWFTSDLHLGHRNIAGPKVSNWKDGYRDFDQANQMDAKLIGNINDLVQPEDTLYFLGDFCLSKDKKDIRAYRDRIACQDIEFIFGNHDKPKEIRAVFPKAEWYMEIEENNTRICMFHYAARVWNKSHRGSIFLYGHSHSNLEYEEWGRSIDVGIDNAYRLFGEYRPFALAEIYSIMSKRQPKYIDHHGQAEDKEGNKRNQ